MKPIKFQISNLKFQINSNDQNSKSQTFDYWEIGIWILFVICHLVLGIFWIKELRSDVIDYFSD